MGEIEDWRYHRDNPLITLWKRVKTFFGMDRAVGLKASMT